MTDLRLKQKSITSSFDDPNNNVTVCSRKKTQCVGCTNYLGMTFNIYFETQKITTIDLDEFEKDNLNTGLVLKYPCDTSFDPIARSKRSFEHALYFKGYDKETNEIIGQNSFG